MLLLVSIALIGLYGSGLYYWYNKMTWSLPTSLALGIKQLHYLAALSCLILLALHTSSNLSLSSDLAIRIILSVTLFTGIPLYIIGDRSVFKAWESYYFLLFSFIPLLVLGVLLFPFIGMILVFSFVGWFIDTDKPVHYEDSKVKVVSYFAGPLGPPHLGIYEKKGWLEKDHTIPHVYTPQIDSVQVRYDPDSTRILIFYAYYQDEQEDYVPSVLSIEKIK